MITINCYYGMRTLINLQVKTIEEAIEIREQCRSQLNSSSDRWKFIAVDSNGNRVLGSY